MTNEIIGSVLECRSKFLKLDHQRCGTWEFLYYLVDVLRLIAPLIGSPKIQIVDEKGCDPSDGTGYIKGTVAFELSPMYVPYCGVEIYRQKVPESSCVSLKAFVGGFAIKNNPQDLHYAALDLVSVLVERGRRSLIPAAFNPDTVLGIFNEMSLRASNHEGA